MSSASGRPPAAIPPPRRSNNAVWWILGIVAGGILVMIFFGLALAGLFIHNLHIHDRANKLRFRHPWEDCGQWRCGPRVRPACLSWRETLG